MQILSTSQNEEPYIHARESWKKTDFARLQPRIRLPPPYAVIRSMSSSRSLRRVTGQPLGAGAGGSCRGGGGGGRGRGGGCRSSAVAILAIVAIVERVVAVTAAAGGAVLVVVGQFVYFSPFSRHVQGFGLAAISLRSRDDGGSHCFDFGLAG